MHIDLITVLPEMFTSILGCSILKRAQDKGLCEIEVHNLRDYTERSTITPSAAMPAWSYRSNPSTAA